MFAKSTLHRNTTIDVGKFPIHQWRTTDQKKSPMLWHCQL